MAKYVLVFNVPSSNSITPVSFHSIHFLCSEQVLLCLTLNFRCTLFPFSTPLLMSIIPPIVRTGCRYLSHGKLCVRQRQCSLPRLSCAHLVHVFGSLLLAIFCRHINTLCPLFFSSSASLYTAALQPLRIDIQITNSNKDATIPRAHHPRGRSGNGLRQLHYL